MRIIAGLYRGRILKSPPSFDVRPTSDRLRETLFNILGKSVVDSRFLDLCAGTGAVGIEALSRGATHSTFVDKSRKMCRLVETNLSGLGVPAEQANVVLSHGSEFLRTARSSKWQPWDILFFDPPYKQDYLEVLGLLGADTEGLITREGVVIVEHFHKNKLPEAVGTLRQTRIVKQGDSWLSFYRRTD